MLQRVKIINSSYKDHNKYKAIVTTKEKKVYITPTLTLKVNNMKLIYADRLKSKDDKVIDFVPNYINENKIKEFYSIDRVNSLLNQYNKTPREFDKFDKNRPNISMYVIASGSKENPLLTYSQDRVLMHYDVAPDYAVISKEPKDYIQKFKFEEFIPVKSLLALESVDLTKITEEDVGRVILNLKRASNSLSFVYIKMKLSECYSSLKDGFTDSDPIEFLLKGLLKSNSIYEFKRLASFYILNRNSENLLDCLRAYK